MCQRQTPDDPDDIDPKDALAAIEGLRFNVELHFGFVGKDQYPRLIKKLEHLLQETLEDGRVSVRIDGDYYEPWKVTVGPVQ